ncbi:hypothetical protein [Halomonas heilongjiangensis]|uniref:Uncharacterized protein n=1 Tax=Halomonas heilongjiangensis TaxID=1387883 RepID=A0A2N7TMP5_9GAMM|nr:hypothetical protein [Halomonas heilongjiangensis]PMR69459.1 hypothetical protein C1H66_10740 [Halomonas heilongjiangensis]PXX89929.1 hypothetical protein CR158_10095 [Halomonas heilongjiangensis]
MKATSLNLLGYRYRFYPAFLAAVLLSMVGMSSVGVADSGTAPSSGFAAMESLDLQEMEAARGREGAIIHFNTVKSVQNMSATVTDSSFNVVNGNMVSGNINFDSNALGRYSGTGIFSAVTGHGNSINNAVGISVFISN